MSVNGARQKFPVVFSVVFSVVFWELDPEPMFLVFFWEWCNQIITPQMSDLP